MSADLPCSGGFGCPLVLRQRAAVSKVQWSNPGGNAEVRLWHLTKFFADRLSLIGPLLPDETDALWEWSKLGDDLAGRRHWTAEEDAELIKRKLAGVSAPRIARELNRSADAVRSRVRQLRRRVRGRKAA